MRQIKCPNCNGNFIPRPEGYYVCNYCGAISEGIGSDLDEQDVIHLDNANFRRSAYKFDEALSLCREVLRRHPDNAEANRCALLAERRIVYLKDDQGNYTATFLDPYTAPITESQYYRNLPERLKREMDKAEEIRGSVLRNLDRIRHHDVFLCYMPGSEEAEWAAACQKSLEKKYTVFCDEADRDDQTGWEPRVYAALKSAKCMILFASSLDHIRVTGSDGAGGPEQSAAALVQNRWKRFLYLRGMDPQKQLIVVQKNIRGELPDPAMREKLLHVDTDPWQSTIQTWVEEICGDSNVTELLKNGDSYISVGKFKKARAEFQKILRIKPNSEMAHWGLLRCRLKAFDDYDIVVCRKKLENLAEFSTALKLAEANGNRELEARIRRIQRAHNAKDPTGFTRDVWIRYREKTKGRRIALRVVAVFCSLVVVAAGAFGFREYSHPLKYTVENGQATLSGTGLFFRMGSHGEVNIDTYGDYPIVAIGNEAFLNGNCGTVKLASSVRTIGESAFAGNKSLTKVTCMSTSVTVGKSAFANCVNLSAIEFGGTSTAARTATARAGGSLSIGAGAFENCISLESITLDGLTDLGANAFRGCINLKEVYINSGTDLRIGLGAFDNVSDALVVRIPSVEEELYNALVREYKDVAFEVYTRDRVEEVVYYIDKIGEVSIDSLTAIERAEQLYDALSAEERGRVTNYGDLRDARAIYTAVAAINRIGTVTLENEADIKSAETAFNALNELQKERVANRETLTDARAVFNTMKRIAEIGSVSLQSKGAIENAEAAYGALNDRQKGMVTNYSVLRDARDAYDVSVAVDLIGRIGTVTETSGSIIGQAEQAYQALSPALRGRVTNYALLQEARQVYNAIAAIARLGLITPDSAADITAAQDSYYALTEAQQGKVTNRALLERAETIYRVVGMIAGLGQLSLGSRSAIEQAETAYGALTETEKARVGNRSELTDARAAFDVMEMIAAIGSVSSANRAQIEAAKEAYDSLTAAQRQKVANQAVLQAAVDDLRIFDAEQVIGEIGQVTLSSRSKIEAAETAYGALTEAQKERVANRSVLVDARHIYDLLVVINELGSVTVGTGTQYSYATLTSGSFPQLNDRAFRTAIDSITFTDITPIQESVWTAAFPNLDLVRYDLTTVTAPPAFTVPSGNLTYVLVGSTSRKYSMKIVAQAGTAVHVGFDNFDLEYDWLPVDLSDAVTSYISFYGNCNIIATGDGSDAIKAKDCSISMFNATVTVQAANGMSVVAGGEGIEAKALTISAKDASALRVIGGNGVDGSDGVTGETGATGISKKGGDKDRAYRAGGKGGDGTDGTDGTNGGDAVVAATLQINGGTVSLIGGNGGAGGAGGAGGTGGRGGNADMYGVFQYRFAGHGGLGGNGGTGGNGGKGGSAITVTSASSDAIRINGATVTFEVGKSGQGGAGGAGGKGGNGANDDWNSLHSGANGGQGGNGGRGGSCYEPQSQTDISNLLTNNGGTVNYVTSDKSATAGAGGAAGEGGAYGVNNNGFGGNGHGSTGDPGNSGASGSVLPR